MCRSTTAARSVHDFGLRRPPRIHDRKSTAANVVYMRQDGHREMYVLCSTTGALIELVRPCIGGWSALDTVAQSPTPPEIDHDFALNRPLQIHVRKDIDANI